MPFPDHFSRLAQTYARFRPGYPPELFAWISRQAAGHQCAWDCGTGNGQAAFALAAYFRKVIASDASVEQLAQAQTHPLVEYRCLSAEDSALPDASVDVITVAQAMHWFDQTRFLSEARRILRPDGILCAWGYNLLRVCPAVDDIINHFYFTTIFPYWPAERRHVEDGYARLPFPPQSLTPPIFTMACSWNLDQLCGYIRSWSACARYAQEQGIDPVAGLEDELARSWPVAPTQAIAIAWPLFVKAARLDPH